MHQYSKGLIFESNLPVFNRSGHWHWRVGTWTGVGIKNYHMHNHNGTRNQTEAITDDMYAPTVIKPRPQQKQSFCKDTEGKGGKITSFLY